MSKFHAQGLANTVWAFATLGISDEKFFRAIAMVAARQLSLKEFKVQGLVNMSWAFAMVSQSD